jgi:hypothetical protein
MKKTSVDDLTFYFPHARTHERKTSNRQKRMKTLRFARFSVDDSVDDFCFYSEIVNGIVNK